METSSGDKSIVAAIGPIRPCDEHRRRWGHTPENKGDYASIVIVRRISSVLNPRAEGQRTPGRATTS